MTERAMPEGELRTLIAKALAERREQRIQREATRRSSPYTHHWLDELPQGVQDDIYADADAVLTVLRPHLGLGVTADALIDLRQGLETVPSDEDLRSEMWALGRNAIYLKPETLIELRAIAGRGAGTAEGQ